MDVIELPEGFVDPRTFLPFGIAPDGTLWVQIRGLAAGGPDARGLARFDDPGWTIFTEPDDGSGWRGWFSSGQPVWLGEDQFAIAPDGSVWLLGDGLDVITPQGRGGQGVGARPALLRNVPGSLRSSDRCAEPLGQGRLDRSVIASGLVGR